MIKTYKELISIQGYDDRLKYVQCYSNVGDMTFGSHRYVNQVLYSSSEWKKTRQLAIIRDNGMDLAHADYPIRGKIYVHHINPLTIDDILERRPCVFDLNNLVCVSFDTHNQLHYGGDTVMQTRELVTRKPNDTCPWKG